MYWEILGFFDTDQSNLSQTTMGIAIFILLYIHKYWTYIG